MADVISSMSMPRYFSEVVMSSCPRVFAIAATGTFARYNIRPKVRRGMMRGKLKRLRIVSMILSKLLLSS
ncbi:MAG: hypothetical protein FWD92_01145 [Methanomassiliicoccaceae archaeon]|nr:hypothetical protein [Methanomassiliicoccaceae archaeon]